MTRAFARVIPAEAGIQRVSTDWIPACAGMTCVQATVTTASPAVMTPIDLAS